MHVYFCFVFTSGDGTLSVFNIRRQKIDHRSDNMETELLSVAIVKVYNIVFEGSWGYWVPFCTRNKGPWASTANH